MLMFIIADFMINITGENSRNRLMKTSPAKVKTLIYQLNNCLSDYLSVCFY